MREVSTTVDVNEDFWFSSTLNANNTTRLPEGDFRLETEGEIWGIERKTWGDALSSWKSKRIEDQLSRLIVNCTHAILVIEGNPDRMYGADNQQRRNLRQFLNRMSLEVCPVVYTDSKEDTAAYLLHLRKRIEHEQIGFLVRKVTVVSSTRNRHHALLESIPKVGRSTAKKLYDHFGSITALVKGLEGEAPKGIGMKTWEAITTFLSEEWKPTEREIIYEAS